MVSLLLPLTEDGFPPKGILESKKLGVFLEARKCGELERSYEELLQKNIEYSFEDEALLTQALTHQSYANDNDTESYERLEFLGDSILDFLVLTAYKLHSHLFFDIKSNNLILF